MEVNGADKVVGSMPAATQKIMLAAMELTRKSSQAQKAELNASTERFAKDALRKEIVNTVSDLKEMLTTTGERLRRP